MDRKRRVEEQKLIASLVEYLERATYVSDFELGKADSCGLKFTRHDGYTFSVRAPDSKERIELRFSVVDPQKKEETQ